MKKLTTEEIKTLLCDAFEGGSNYWYVIIGKIFAPGLTFEDFKEGGKMQEPGNYFHPYEIIPLTPGCGLAMRGDDDRKAYTLNLETIEKGMRVMAEKYPKHYVDALEGNDDATTGDVFLQCCLFGEVIYS